MERTKTKQLRFVMKMRPKAYPMTPQQKVMKEAAEFCGIKPGITRSELVDKMINCLPEFYAKRKTN